MAGYLFLPRRMNVSDKQKKVVVFGSFIVDLTARASHHPMPGETVFGSSFRMGPGGKGFNQAVAAHKAGADVEIVTAVGNDAFQHILFDTMECLGMASSVMVSENRSTGTALITVDENSGQNEIVVVTAACEEMNEAAAESVRPLLEDADILLMQFEIGMSAIIRASEIVRKAGGMVILNPAPVRDFPESLYRNIDLIIPNETEAEKLTGISIEDENAALAAARYFEAQGVSDVLITLGERGAFLYSHGTPLMIPPYQVKCIDSTGAGDAFCGGLVTALAEGKKLEDAAVFASATAALSVTRAGTAPSMPYRKEIDSFLMLQR